MNPRKALSLAEPILGDERYKERARRAFPILVRQAEVKQTVFYGDLAEELAMSNPRNLNRVLGAIGRTIENLSKSWRTKIPPIECLVVNKKEQLPGPGIGYFLVKDREYSELPIEEKRKIVEHALIDICAFADWHKVLSAVGLSPLDVNFRDMNRRAAQINVGSGESEHHLRFKNFVACNPSVVGLPSHTSSGEVEIGLPSGDKADVSFSTSREWIVAEVKSEISSQYDIHRGIFQCIKYLAVMRAQDASEGRKRNIRVVLVLEGAIPKNLVPLKNMLGIEVLDNVSRS